MSEKCILVDTVTAILNTAVGKWPKCLSETKQTDAPCKCQVFDAGQNDPGCWSSGHWTNIFEITEKNILSQSGQKISENEENTRKFVSYFRQMTEMSI